MPQQLWPKNNALHKPLMLQHAAAEGGLDGPISANSRAPYTDDGSLKASPTALLARQQHRLPEGHLQLHHCLKATACCTAHT